MTVHNGIDSSVHAGFDAAGIRAQLAELGRRRQAGLVDEAEFRVLRDELFRPLRESHLLLR